MPNSIINFTNQIDATEPPYNKMTCIDVSALSGTDMYCDDEAYEVIINALLDAAVKSNSSVYSGIHFIDSGNYHYMTRLFTSQIDFPYQLIFFDKHTDCKSTMFDMLSCGSWAKHVLERDTYCKQMIMVGPPESSLSEQLCIEGSEKNKLITFSEEYITETANTDAFISPETSGQKNRLATEIASRILPDIPIYISIDKDALSHEYAHTNWDQGVMTLTMLTTILSEIRKSSSILGCDICGGMGRDTDYTDEDYRINQSTDISILNALS